jgi:hypothetical protein
MKLMGMPKLRNLARSGPDEMAGAVGALCAELLGADWKSPVDVVAQYPASRVDGAKVRISVDETHLVDLVVNYHAGIILISEASAHGGRSVERLSKGSETA